MATAEAPARPHDRHSRRRPFANWMKRLANLKSSSSSDSHTDSSGHKQRSSTESAKSKKSARNNPYPSSGPIYSPGVERTNGHLSFSEPPNSLRRSQSSHSGSYTGENDQPTAMTGRKSVAPTLSTNCDTIMSDAAYSKAGTTATAGGRGGGEGSTFSSPAPSVRSLTTTLTTVQSGAPNHYMTGGAHHHSSQGGSQHTIQFTHQFPTTPVSAIPPHVTPHPTTYTTATANNLLTDNASVLTLASSSKRRRRNSLDTNASVRALAPSSLFSGSRESLPLSVLSGNMGSINTAPGGGEYPNTTASALGRGGNVNAERASVYSVSGAGLADRSSIRSGLQSHHARNDSATGSISGLTANSYLVNAQGRVSRRGSGWGEIPGAEDNEYDQERIVKEDLEETEGGEAGNYKGQEKSS